jgi:caffeic acid 3-O-methyltransferase
MIQMLLLCACSDAVLNSEEPFTKANGMNQFEYMQSHPAFMAMFKDGLVDISPALLPMLLSKYHGFEGVQKLLDVGGSTAEILVGIKHKYPHIHAINFDLPGVIASNPNLPGTFINAAYPPGECT